MRNQNKGFVILENAASVLAVIMIVLSIADVTRIFQARNALELANTKTLRCLSPADADCVVNHTPQFQAIYDVNMNYKEERWPYTNYNFNGESSWLEQDVSLYSNPTARVLDNVSYKKRRVPATFQRVTYDGFRTTSNNMMIANKPYIVSNNRVGELLNPAFVYKESKRRDYRDSQTIFNGADRGYNNTKGNLKEISAVDFTTRNIDLTNCVKSNKINEDNPRGGHNPTTTSCGNLIPIVIFAEGSFPANIANVSNSQGVVHMQLKGDGLQIIGASGGRKRNLGGRAFTYNPNDNLHGNFYPRGVGSDNVDDTRGNLEFSRYRKILVKPNTAYTLKFFLELTKGKKTAWELNRIRVFYPKFEKYSVTEKCDEYHKNISKCIKDDISHTTTLRSSASYSEKIINTEIVAHECKEDAIKVDINEIPCASNQVCTPLDINLNDTKTCGHIPLVSKTEQCDQGNHGVVGNPNSESYFNAIKTCGVDLSNPLIDTTSKFVFTEKDISFNNSFEYVRETCDMPVEAPESAYPSELKNYAKITWNKTVLNPKSLYTEIDVDEFKAENLEYACLHTKKMAFKHSDLEEEPDGFKQTLFYGYHSLVETGCNWEETLKSDAVSLGAPEDAYFKANRVAMGEITYLPYDVGLSCYNKDPVTSFFGAGNTVNGGPYFQNEIPKECQDKDIKCDLTFVGYQKDSEEDFRVDDNLAVDKGYEAVRAMYPQANNCNEGGQNCFNMEVEFDGEEFNVNSSLDVPLFTLLGQKKITVPLSKSAYWEGKHLIK